MAAQKTYSRVVKFALSRCSLVIYGTANIFDTGMFGVNDIARPAEFARKYAKINVPTNISTFTVIYIPVRGVLDSFLMRSEMYHAESILCNVHEYAQEKYI